MELNKDEPISLFIPFIVSNKMLLDCKTTYSTFGLRLWAWHNVANVNNATLLIRIFADNIRVNYLSL